MVAVSTTVHVHMTTLGFSFYHVLGKLNLLLLGCCFAAFRGRSFQSACEEVLYVAGFNYAEASNTATPAWLRVAKEAAVRRASINRPPMVSHYQLLYELALSMCLRYSSYVVCFI